MDVFGIGPLELIFVLIIMLIVLGPTFVPPRCEAPNLDDSRTRPVRGVRPSLQGPQPCVPASPRLRL